MVIESGDYFSGLRILKIFTEHYQSSYDKTLNDELKPVALKLAKYFEDENQIGNALLVYNALLDLDRFDYEYLINKGRLHEISGEYSFASFIEHLTTAIICKKLEFWYHFTSCHLENT